MHAPYGRTLTLTFTILALTACGGDAETPAEADGSVVGTQGPGTGTEGPGTGTEGPEDPACAEGSVESRVRSRSPDVDPGEECASEVQMRACDGDGNWGAWSGTFEHASCQVREPRACGDIGHGALQSRVRYQTETVPVGAACVAETQTRSCADGELSDWTGSYGAENCSAQVARACGAIAHGAEEKRLRYELARVPYGRTCRAEVQVSVCDNGRLGPYTGSFGFDTCVVAEPAPCEETPSGGQQSRVRYEEPMLPSGSACVFEVQTRTCDNGVFSGWTGTLTHEECIVTAEPTCDGTPEGGEQSRVRYQRAAVPYGSKCVSEVQVRSCTGAAFSPWSGSFVHTSCEVEEPAACGDKPHGYRVQRTRYQTARVRFGEQCASEVQESACDNGTLTEWSGSFENEACEVDSPRNCGLIAHGEFDSRVRYAQGDVPYDRTCSSEVQTSKCHDGTLGEWSGSFAFTRCTVAEPLPCEHAPHGTVESRTRYLHSQVAASESCEGEVQTRECAHGQWSDWTGNFSEPACTTSLPSPCGSVPHGEEEARVRYEATESRNRPCLGETQRRVCQDGNFSVWSGSFVHASCSICEDVDNDQYGKGCSKGPDCDDNAAHMFPGAREVPWNGVDENCDGKLGQHLEVVHRFANREVYPESVVTDRDYVFMFATTALEVRKIGALDKPIAVHPGIRYAQGSAQLHAGILVVDNDRGVRAERELIVHDFRDVTRAPAPVARLPFISNNPAFSLSRDGKRLYVRTDALRVHDLSVPEAPELVSELSLPACHATTTTSLNLADNGRYLFFACPSSNSSTLWVKRRDDVAPDAWKVLSYARGKVIFNSALEHDGWWESDQSSRSLYELEWSDLSQPKVRSRNYTTSADGFVASTKDLVVHARFDFRPPQSLCIKRGAAQEQCVTNVDIGNPLFVHGNRLIMGPPNHLREYDISASPVLAGEWRSLPVVSGHNGAEILVRGGVGYGASRAGLVVLDLLRFTEPVTLVGGSTVTALLVEGDFAYHTAGGSSIVDVRVPFAPKTVGGRIFTMRTGATVARRNGTPYIVNPSGTSLDVWSLSQPTSPMLAASIDGINHGQTSRLFDDGRYVYSNRAGTIGLYRFDGSKLTFVREYGKNVSDVLPRGGRLYWLGDGVVHISDPDTTRDLETISIPSRASNFWNTGADLFVTARDLDQLDSNGIWFLNETSRSVERVSLPDEIEHCDPTGAGGGLFLCDSERGLFVLRVVAE